MTDTTNPKDLLGVKKVQLNLVPAASLIYQALAMEDGAKKYGPYNWRAKKVKASIYIAACMRHLQQWQDGENVAEDSQKPHLGHAIACLGIIIDALETGNLVDDRPLPGAASKLIAQFEKQSPPKVVTVSDDSFGILALNHSEPIEDCVECHRISDQTIDPNIRPAFINEDSSRKANWMAP